MPELPEVETIKRQLTQKVEGLVIKNILINKPKLFYGNPSDIIGKQITKITRRAKIIVIDLSNKRHLLIHLKMTGQLIFVDERGSFGGGHPIPPFNLAVPNKYSHIIIEFTNGSKLYFNDIRQFGWIKIVNSKELNTESEKFGPEPLGKDFTIEIFKDNLLRHKNKPIKPVLMDQSVVAGLGNIYAAEACFHARIRPDRKISTLSDKDFQNLFDAICEILPLAIKYQGVSADDYVTLEGKTGDYYKKLLVYDREGEPCPAKCGGKIAKFKLAGRGTYWCPKCQH